MPKEILRSPFLYILSDVSIRYVTFQLIMFYFICLIWLNLVIKYKILILFNFYIIHI